VVFEIDFRRSCPGLRVSPEKKNVLCIVLHMVVGGAERVVLNIARSVDRERFCFHLVTTIPAENIWRKEFERFFANVVVPKRAMGNDDMLKRYFFRLVERLGIDILMVSVTPAGYGHLAEMKERFPKLTVIDVVHSDVRSEGPDWFAGVLERAMAHIDRRVYVCDGARRHWLDVFARKGLASAYERRLLTIPNGVDMDGLDPDRRQPGLFRARHGIPHRAKIVSFIGRMSAEKNPLLFVEVARRVMEKVPGTMQVRFAMAGDGPELQAVKKRILAGGMTRYFSLPGMIDDVAELLRDSYLLVATSRYEGAPLAVLEAMAMRVPVMSNRVGIMGDLIEDDTNGYLIDAQGTAGEDDPIAEVYADRIVGVLKETDRHAMIARKARDTVVRGYTLETMGSRYQGLFEELTGKSGASAPDAARPDRHSGLEPRLAGSELFSKGARQ
jgi:glycosyltransferase involved in cell wall biosynthesis